MSRIKERQNAMCVIYEHILCNKDMRTVIDDNQFVTDVTDFLPRYAFGEEMLTVLSTVEARKGIYAAALNQMLKGWKFDRLGHIEQAILLLACSELELGYQPKQIVMNEAISLAKNFGDETSYKLINGVLDSL